MSQPRAFAISVMSELRAPQATTATAPDDLDGEGELIDEPIVEVGAVAKLHVVDLIK